MSVAAEREHSLDAAEPYPQHDSVDELMTLAQRATQNLPPERQEYFKDRVRNVIERQEAAMAIVALVDDMRRDAVEDVRVANTSGADPEFARACGRYLQLIVRLMSSITVVGTFCREVEIRLLARLRDFDHQQASSSLSA